MIKPKQTDIELLHDLRTRLETKIRSTKTTARDLPALSRELRNVLHDIGELAAEHEETQAEKIKREREERRAARRTNSDLPSGPEE